MFDIKITRLNKYHGLFGADYYVEVLKGGSYYKSLRTYTLWGAKRFANKAVSNYKPEEVLHQDSIIKEL